MTDRRDDDFRIRPSAPKNRGQGFVSKVLKQTGKASSGKSSVRRPGTAGGTGRGTGQRPGSRLGRGHTAARFAGAKLTPMSRRVTIKTLLVNQRQASTQSLAKHLRYIERDGVGRDGEPGQAYGPQTDAADLDAFKERCADDRHHFRFILSPEDGAELEDLRTYTRHLMGHMEADLGTGLDWVAVNHWNTDNPHTHIVVRGHDDTGKDLIIAGDYIADGFRHRAAELATEWLGPRTELEIQQTLQREVAHPFDVGGEVQRGHDDAQVARHRLLPGEQGEDAGLETLAEPVDLGVVGDHLLGVAEVAVEQRGGGPTHRDLGHPGHGDQRRADRVQFVVVQIAHSAPPPSGPTTGCPNRPASGSPGYADV